MDYGGRFVGQDSMANSDPEIDPEMPLSFILPYPDAIVGSCNREMSRPYLRTVLVEKCSFLDCSFRRLHRRQVLASRRVP